MMIFSYMKIRRARLLVIFIFLMQSHLKIDKITYHLISYA